MHVLRLRDVGERVSHVAGPAGFQASARSTLPRSPIMFARPDDRHAVAARDVHHLARQPWAHAHAARFASTTFPRKVKSRVCSPVAVDRPARFFSRSIVTNFGTTAA